MHTQELAGESLYLFTIVEWRFTKSNLKIQNNFCEECLILICDSYTPILVCDLAIEEDETYKINAELI